MTHLAFMELVIRRCKTLEYQVSRMAWERDCISDIEEVGVDYRYDQASIAFAKRCDTSQNGFDLMHYENGLWKAALMGESYVYAIEAGKVFLDESDLPDFSIKFRKGDKEFEYAINVILASIL